MGEDDDGVDLAGGPWPTHMSAGNDEDKQSLQLQDLPADGDRKHHTVSEDHLECINSESKDPML